MDPRERVPFPRSGWMSPPAEVASPAVRIEVIRAPARARCLPMAGMSIAIEPRAHSVPADPRTPHPAPPPAPRPDVPPPEVEDPPPPEHPNRPVREPHVPPPEIAQPPRERDLLAR